MPSAGSNRAPSGPQQCLSSTVTDNLAEMEKLLVATNIRLENILEFLHGPVPLTAPTDKPPASGIVQRAAANFEYLCGIAEKIQRIGNLLGC